MKTVKKCGLLGRKLGHSYSPLIHSYLGDYEYELFEREPEDVGRFMLEGEFDAINVTVPYKSTVIEYLDSLSDVAKRIGAVNTIVRTEDGRLVGDNTDYYGFTYMMGRAHIDVKGKKVLVLGSGGSSLAVRAALEDMGASRIVVISRTGENNYENVAIHSDAHVIVNTTPVGMYPKNGESPLSLDCFTELEGVADLIFNPKNTELIFRAKEKGIRCVSGLSMLVAQAKVASERFCSCTIPDERIEQILSVIERMTENIVLVGMPGSGKSTAARLLAELLGRDTVDTDAVIVEQTGKSIPEIFALEGEEAFRAYEHRAICDTSKRSGLIIATGGGAPTRVINHRPMKQNGRVVYLVRDPDELSRDGRPLSQGADMKKMFEDRRPFYEGCADITVEVLDTPEQTARQIVRALGYEALK